jgi:hypothetical protein
MVEYVQVRTGEATAYTVHMYSKCTSHWKNTCYPPALMECRLCLSAQLSNTVQKTLYLLHTDEKRDFDRGMKVGIIAVLADRGDTGWS